ncbi:MAG: phage tail protein [Planctomycetes bacterium]|nr:phage tail protein [Planctomycetota bacterium]
MPANQPFIGNFNFLVEIEGITGDAAMVVGGFSEVSGIGSQTEIIEYRTGNSRSVLQIPGKTRYSNIVLKKGVTSSNELFLWRQAIEKGNLDRRSGSIILLDPDMNEKTRWNFYEAWPCRYEAPVLNSAGDAISIEALELCVGRLERVEAGA